MSEQVLFLGGHMTGLRRPLNPIWRHALHERIPFIKARAQLVKPFDPDPSVGAPAYDVELYRFYDFGALDCSFMVLDGLDPRRALSQYLRGEPIL